MKRRPPRKSWCVQCRGKGWMAFWLGIRPRTIKSTCGACLGSGDGAAAERLSTRTKGAAK